MLTRGVIAVGLLFVVGCGGTTIDSSGTRSGAGVGKSAPSGSGGATVKDAPVSSGDSGGGAANGASGTTAPPDPCSPADLGQVMPLVFAKLNHEEQVCDGPGSNCVDFFEFRFDCGLTFQANNDARVSVASAGDCTRLMRFASSQFLFDGLNDKASCLPPADGNPPEMTEIELTTGPGPRKKTAICNEEPFKSLRECVHSVVQKYFLGTK